MQPFCEIVTNASRATLPRLNSQPAEMLHGPPAQNERTAVSLLRESGLQPRYTHEDASMRVTGVTLTPTPATNWQKCGLVIAGLMAPAPEESLLQWLSTMAVLVAKREQGETISELEMVAYARKLRAWPGDVVRDVLDRYPDENKWWPEWATLRARLAEAASGRILIASAFQRWTEAPDFMARREGIAPPVEMAKRIDPPARPPQVHLDRPEPMSQEARAAKLAAMKAAIAGGEDVA